MELVGAMLKALAISKVIRPNEKNDAHWEALHRLSTCIDITPYADPWAESREVQISGGKSDSIKFFFADQTVEVGGIRKHLQSFKYKALHGKTKFQNRNPTERHSIPTRERNAYYEDKDFLQKNYLESRHSEEFYLPNDWLSSHAPSFSLQQKLAEGLPLGVPLRNAGLSASEEHALQIALKAPFQRRVDKLRKIPVNRDGTFIVRKVDVADKTEYYANAAKVDALAGKLTDKALAKMLVFTVEFTESPDGSGVPKAPVIWRTTLHDKETRAAVAAINTAVNSAGGHMKDTLHRINRYAMHAVDDAIQTPAEASDPFGYTVTRSPATRAPTKR